MRVSEIWRYPVKSIGGETLTEAPFDERGIEFDRAWGIYDPATELVLTARREPALLFLGATVLDGRPVITTVDGDDVSGDEALSDHLGRPVELRWAGDGPVTFENPMNVDDETDWVRWQSAGQTFHDGRSTISIVSRTALRDWDARRFRINLILDGDGGGGGDGGDGGRTDDDGVGELSGELLLGSGRITMRKPIDRCIMVSRAQPGIERDLDVLKTIIRERSNQLGFGCVVTGSGVVAVGDELGVS